MLSLHVGGIVCGILSEIHLRVDQVSPNIETHLSSSEGLGSAMT